VKAHGETALQASPGPVDDVAAARPHKPLRVLALYVLLTALVYAPVIFAGKSLMPALYQPHGVVPAGVYSRAGRVPVPTFNVDIATPAYYELPINSLVGETYASGALPLWNPYQGSGTPLVAQYSTRAFFPYQILEDMSPAALWDFFMLARLPAAGFFTCLFLSAVGLGLVPAFIGGLFYMFSGSFVWFVNLEQMTNVAMMLPVLMYATERNVRTRGRGRALGRETAITGVCVGLLLLAGQPEVALYASALSFGWYVFRSASLYGPRRIPGRVLRFALAYMLGLAIASPLIVPFVELVHRSFHIHHSGGAVGAAGLVVWKSIFALINPSATELLTGPESADALVPMYDAYFRFLPINGVWDGLGGYTGILPVFLIVAGLFCAFGRKGPRGRGPLLFFAAFASVIILKNLGIAPFVWIGRLPLFDRVWGLRWSGPSWVFAVSASAAIALEIITRRAGEGPVDATGRRRVFYAFALVCAVYLLVPLKMALALARAKDALFTPAAAAYIVPSVLGSSLVALIILLLSALALARLSRRTAEDARGVPAIAALGFAELWWAVPRGYDATWLPYKWIPFIIALVAAFLLLSNRKRAAFMAAAVFFIASLSIDTLSPSGLPPRDDPFREAPYVDFLRSRPGHFRVMGAYGVLFPNYASALGIYDVRYVNSLMTREYHDFSTRRLHADYVEEDPVSRLWFTGRPERKLAGLRTFASIEEDIVKSLRGYSLLGVEYFLMPAPGEPGARSDAPTLEDVRDTRGERVFKLVYDREVRIYSNPFALPRAFVAHAFIRADSFEEAQERVMTPGFEMGRTVVLEADPAGLVHTAGTGESSARITEYRAGRVVVEVDALADGVLVLTDTFYPGWKARVNGAPAAVMRADGLVRAVVVRKGASTVEFVYSPSWFRPVAALFAGSLLLCIVLVARGSRRRRYDE